jgi:hypothetical protein
VSESTTGQNEELARVLDRIQALTQPVAAPVEEPEVEELPVLTEIYEGEPLVFASHSLEDFPALRQLAGYQQERGAIPPEVIDSLLQEMRPVLRSAVRAAVEQELMQSTQALCDKLEAELLQALRKRLESNLEIRGI